MAIPCSAGSVRRPGDAFASSSIQIPLFAPSGSPTQQGQSSWSPHSLTSGWQLRRLAQRELLAPNSVPYSRHPVREHTAPISNPVHCRPHGPPQEMEQQRSWDHYRRLSVPRAAADRCPWLADDDHRLAHDEDTGLAKSSDDGARRKRQVCRSPRSEAPRYQEALVVAHH